MGPKARFPRPCRDRDHSTAHVHVACRGRALPNVTYDGASHHSSSSLGQPAPEPADNFITSSLHPLGLICHAPRANLPLLRGNLRHPSRELSRQLSRASASPREHSPRPISSWHRSGSSAPSACHTPIMAMESGENRHRHSISVRRYAQRARHFWRICFPPARHPT